MRYNLQNFTEEYNMKVHGQKGWMEINGYPITIEVLKDEIVLKFSFQIINNPDLSDQIRNALMELRKKKSVFATMLREDKIQISIKNEELDDSLINGIINDVLSILQLNSIDPIECSICNDSNHSKDKVTVLYNDMISHVHKDCYENKIDNYDKVVGEMGFGSYLTGVMGSVAFGFIGIIPWVIVSLFGFIWSMLGLVIGISCEYGYNLLKGKKGPLKKFILTAVVIIMVILATYIAQSIEFYQVVKEEYGTTMSVVESLKIVYIVFVENPEYKAEIIKNVLIGIVFAVLGAKSMFKKDEYQLNPNKKEIELVNEMYS